MHLHPHLLRQRLPIPQNSTYLNQKCSSGELAEHQTAIIAATGEVLASTLQQYGITARLRIAHFLGQTCHESAGFCTAEEFASGDA
jgi:predicted chitinase